MNHFKTLPALAALAAAVVLAAPGCATRNVNPPHARANTGYVDFHVDPAAGLCWDVGRWDDRAGAFQPVYSEFKSSLGGVLRLAFAPGPRRFCITFLNCVIAKPAEIDVEVQNEKITPVHVTLTEAGTTLVKTKETSRGGTVYGRYGRRTIISNDETVTYGVSAMADPAVAYQPKEQMPYGR